MEQSTFNTVQCRCVSFIENRITSNIKSPTKCNTNGMEWNKQACFAGCVKTLSDATAPIGKIHQFSKIAVTFEPIKLFLYSMGFRTPLICITGNWKHNPYPQENSLHFHIMVWWKWEQFGELWIPWDLEELKWPVV